MTDYPELDAEIDNILVPLMTGLPKPPKGMNVTAPSLDLVKAREALRALMIREQAKRDEFWIKVAKTSDQKHVSLSVLENNRVQLSASSRGAGE